jgi:hypothetical protein
MRLGLQKWGAWEEEISLLLPYMIEALPRLIDHILSISSRITRSSNIYLLLPHAFDLVHVRSPRSACLT